MAKMPLLLAIVVLACRFLALAQYQPNQSTHSLLVGVLDSRGNAAPSLTKNNFRVKVNGHPAVLRDAPYSIAPRRIAVLLDTSGSMAGKTKWLIAREAVDDLLSDTPADVHIALLTFSDQVHDVFDFSQTRDSIVAWLKERPSAQGVKISGRTALYDSVLAATKLLEPTRAGDAIYIISDGGDNASNISDTETRKLLLRSRIRLFVFLLAEPMIFAQERSEPDSIVRLARATGGFVFGVKSDQIALAGEPWEFAYDYDERTRSRVRLYTQALNIQVNGFFTLQFDASPTERKSNKVSVEVIDNSGKVRKDLAWTYPEAFPATGK